MKNTHDKCLICNSNIIKELPRYRSNYLVKCKSCGFVFCNKIPEIDELKNHYNGYPRNTDISSITIKRYHELLNVFEKYRFSNNILDIGCGDGHFLVVAKERNWNVYGTEYTNEAIKICRAKKIEVSKGILDVNNYDQINFDVITSFEVIEHINNPVEEVININKLLRIGGAFYFTTPNFNSLNRSILKNEWSVIEFPEHLSYYTRKTISELLKKNNFEKKFFQVSGFSFSQLLKKKSHREIGNEKKVIEENFRASIESSFYKKFIKDFFNKILNVTRKGDTLKGLFVKK
ncbi:MAG: class I SAM-dependent methyltransferase [Bacteroidetes bacterium]|nr:class I SAM-dependent methyltransferase [Bacteroidota bacterium]